MILPIYLVYKEISPEIITLIICLATTLFIIRFIWRGIADYFARFGRKRFIILGGILSVVGLLLLASIDPSTALHPFAIFKDTLPLRIITNTTFQ